MEDALLNRLPPTLRLKEAIKREILSGAHGESGQRFMTVRELAGRYGVSLVTAQRVMTALRDEKVVILNGNKSLVRVPRGAPSGRLLGMVVTNLENPFFASLARETQQAAERAGARTLLAGSDYDPKRESEVLATFRAAGVQGILACPGVDPGAKERYAALKVPFVFISRTLEGLDADAVLPDNRAAARQTARHFMELGHTRFAYVGPRDLREDPRWDGFRQALQSGGRELSAVNAFLLPIKDFEKERRNLADFLRDLPKPVAVFCFHDLLAALVIRLCRQQAIRVPEDLAVAGFDDLPIAAALTPSLTTSSYPIKDMAEIAVKVLLEKIERPNGVRPTRRLLDPILVVRESTAPEAREMSMIPTYDFSAYQFAGPREEAISL